MPIYTDKCIIYSLSNTYLGLIDRIRFIASNRIYHNIGLIYVVDIIIKKLKTRRIFHKSKYDWLRKEQILEYITSSDYDTFMIGYQLLESEGIL